MLAQEWNIFRHMVEKVYLYLAGCQKLSFFLTLPYCSENIFVRKCHRAVENYLLFWLCLIVVKIFLLANVIGLSMLISWRWRCFCWCRLYIRIIVWISLVWCNDDACCRREGNVIFPVNSNQLLLKVYVGVIVSAFIWFAFIWFAAVWCVY